MAFKNYILFIAIIVFAFCGCRKPSKTIKTTITTKEIVNTTYKDTTIHVAGDKVTADFNYDSIRSVLITLKSQGKEPTIIYQNNDESATSLRMYLDDMGQLKVDCTTRDQYIEFLEKEVERIKTTREVREIKKVITPNWMKLLLILMGIVILMLLGSNIFLIFKGKPQWQK